MSQSKSEESEGIIDPIIFKKRVDKLFQNWENYDEWNVNCFEIGLGKIQEKNNTGFLKCELFHTWLFGLQFLNSVCIFVNSKHSNNENDEDENDDGDKDDENEEGGDKEDEKEKEDKKDKKNVSHRKIFILTSEKIKKKYFDPLINSISKTEIDLRVFTKNKKKKKIYKHIFLKLKKHSKKNKNKDYSFGQLTNEVKLNQGKFIDGWKEKVNKLISKGNKPKDISKNISDCFLIKSFDEISQIKLAASFCAKILIQKSFEKKMNKIVNDEKNVTHIEFQKKLESDLHDEEKKRTKLIKKYYGNQKDLAPDDFELSFSPIIRSGSNCVSNFTSPLERDRISNPKRKLNNAEKKNLQLNTIFCYGGAKYQSYCASIGRSFFINATPTIKKNYNFLIEIRNTILNLMKKKGLKLYKIYETAKELVKSKHENLLKYFSNNCGHSIGLDCYEDNLILDENIDKNKVLQPGMVFVVRVSFSKIPSTKKNKDNTKANYPLFIADTVSVTESKREDHLHVEILTKESKVSYNEVSYELNLDESEEEEESETDEEEEEQKRKDKRRMFYDNLAKQHRMLRPDGYVTRTKAKKVPVINQEEKRRKRQNEILKNKRDEYSENRHNKSTSKKQKKYSTNEKLANGELFCFNNFSEVPSHLKPNKLQVDGKNETLFLPMNDSTHVPIHIATIKNVSKTDEGDHIFLRINFKGPGVTFGNAYEPAKKFPNKVFLSEISFRAKDPRNITQNVRMINELKKRITQREKDINVQQSLVVQEPLKLSRPNISKGQIPIRLRGVHSRPTQRGKKVVGNLEAHQNGFRFISKRNEKIDILYANIKHAFFQAAKNETIVLIHFHLHNPILVGKKGTNNIQFFTEVIEESDHLTGRSYRRSITLNESIEEENRERELKEKLNKQFYNFAKRVENAHGIEFEVPYRDLAFKGTPNRSHVVLYPTISCLVSLQELPFFVLPLDEIEIAFFERVSFQLREFDLVFVQKDYSKPVISVNSIPVEKLDLIQDWLTEVEIVYFKGPASLAWNKLMKRIREDKFFAPWDEEEGWKSILNFEEEGEEEEEEEEMDEYVPSCEDEDYDSEEYQSDEEYDEDDSESDEEYEEEEEEEKGKSWDDIEKDARNYDRKRKEKDEDFSDEEEYPRIKKKRRFNK